MAGQGAARQGVAGLGWAGQVPARPGGSRQGVAGSGAAWRVTARQVAARPGGARHGRARREWTRPLQESRIMCDSSGNGRQGEGPNTRRKIEGFRDLFRVRLAGVSKGGRAKDFPYWHLDMNCGSGWNEAANCAGSPVVFLEEVLRSRRHTHAYFCDVDTDAVSSLCRRIQLPDDPSLCAAVFINDGDNADRLGEFAEDVRRQEKPRFAVGSVLCDPNGWKGFPVEALRQFFAEFARIDCILNLNSSFISMVRGCKKNAHIPACRPFASYPDLEDLIGMFNKGFWLVRNPSLPGRGMNFISLCGSNFETHTFKDWYRAESTRGQEIITSLHRVDPNQPLFWE
jgi:three-Cys-motif partner protein